MGVVVKMNTKQKKKLLKFIKGLEQFRGRHTELVSIYVPTGYDLIKIIQHVQQEQGTAQNIKDKNNRTNVIDSLEKIIRHLRLFKRTPENGLAVFAGNISDKDNKTDIQVFSIEPPEQIQLRTYRCDQTFLLDPLKDMIEEKEVYGLIVVDNREGNVGLLKGTQIVEISRMTSDVPGKTTKGGQCLNKNSVVQINDGDIEKIGNLHNPYLIKSADFNNGNLLDSNIVDKWDTKKDAYKIITKTPRLEIESSKDHIFFVRDECITEKSVGELNVGDYLLMPEKINVKGKIQSLNFEDIKYLNEEFSQFLGYFIGDGNLDTNRIVFSEQNKELADYYKNFFHKLFKLDIKSKLRNNKNYYEIRIYSKILHNFIKNEFKEIKKSLDTEIPKKILRSPDKIVARFVNGLFDAEGYVTKNELSIGMNNKYLIQQLQMLLLRFSIISSFCEYDNRRNKYSNNFRYTLRITDIDSLNNFKKNIGFNFSEKRNKLNNLIINRTKRGYNRQIFHNGKNIRKIIEQYGLLKKDFPQVSNFFFNKRQMSKNVFKDSILNRIKNNKSLYLKLKALMDYNLIPVKIKEIQKLGKMEMSDISVKNQNFIANCVIVHNSQGRYERIREIAAKEFHKKIAGVANKEFLEMKNLKGILVGGPGHTKETFLDGNYLNNEVKKKIMGVKDLSYTGEFGLRELVSKSKDLLAEQASIKERELLNKFFTLLAKDPKKVVYGKTKTLKALSMSAVDTLILSDDLDDKFVEEMEEESVNYGTSVEIVSAETEEGNQLKELGGIAGILRFEIHL